VPSHTIVDELIVCAGVRGEFTSLLDGSIVPNCVVMGDAADEFSWENMNSAFRTLLNMQPKVLITMGNG
jgi:hypothetical protein